MTADDIIKKLDMFPIHEGGMCAENLRSREFTETPRGRRHAWTSIYYLLREGEHSCFHRLRSDELWAHHAGGCFTIYILEDGRLRTQKLGGKLEEGALPQALLPAGTVFAATVEGSYGLCGCISVPGFHDDDLELLDARAIGVADGGGIIDILCYGKNGGTV